MIDSLLIAVHAFVSYMYLSKIGRNSTTGYDLVYQDVAIKYVSHNNTKIPLRCFEYGTKPNVPI